jgi:hypothetical protein
MKLFIFSLRLGAFAGYLFFFSLSPLWQTIFFFLTFYLLFLFFLLSASAPLRDTSFLFSFVSFILRFGSFLISYVPKGTAFAGYLFFFLLKQHPPLADPTIKN